MKPLRRVLFCLLLAAPAVRSEESRPAPAGGADPAAPPQTEKPADTPTGAKSTGQGMATAKARVPEVPPVEGMGAARLLPMGTPCKGVRMPEFDRITGALVSHIRVRELKRISEDQLQLTDMEMERYALDGTRDYVVSVSSGFYDMTTRKLTSQYPTRARGRAFDIQGQGCDFSQGAPVIRILGHVVSYLYPDRVETQPSDPKAPVPPAPSTPTESKEP